MKKLSLLTIFFIFLSYNNKIFGQDINSQLFNAVLKQNLDSIKILLQKGADINAINVYGITPLLYAVDIGNYNICKFLLENGANPNYIPPYDPPALSMAVINNRDSILVLLLKNKANPDIVDNFGYIPLTYAIYYGNYLAADNILYYGADPNKDFKGWTPLELASYFDDTLLVKMLLFYGANPNKLDSTGLSALHICAQNNSVYSASTLLKNGANPNLNQGNNGLTPLISSIFFRNNQILDTLLKYKANVKIKVFNKFSPTSVAILAQNYPAKKRLKKLGSPSSPMMFDIILGTTSFINHQNLFAGIQVGLKELNSNIDLTFEMSARPTPKRIFFALNDNNFLQLWEQRWFMSSKLSKNFYIFSYRHKNFYIRTSLLASYTYANYRGSLRKNSNFFMTPEIGLGCDVNYFTFNFDFVHIKLEGINTFPIFLNFSADIKLSPYKFDIKRKNFSLGNEPIF